MAILLAFLLSAVYDLTVYILSVTSFFTTYCEVCFSAIYVCSKLFGQILCTRLRLYICYITDLIYTSDWRDDIHIDVVSSNKEISEAVNVLDSGMCSGAMCSGATTIIPPFRQRQWKSTDTSLLCCLDDLVGEKYPTMLQAFTAVIHNQ